MALRRKLRNARAPIPKLSTALVDLLVTGESPTGPFIEFDVSDEQLATLWHTRGPALRAEARRRGIDRLWIEEYLSERTRRAEEARARTKGTRPAPVGTE